MIEDNDTQLVNLDGFGHWLAGFADGEGCFYIKPVGYTSTNGEKQAAYVPSFVIGLREDDAAILEEVRQRTGLGEIRHYTGTGRKREGQQVRWEVTRKADTLALAALFDRYPLRAKKARDFALWREAVLEREKIVVRRKADWSRIIAVYEALKAGRKSKAQGAFAV